MCHDHSASEAIHPDHPNLTHWVPGWPFRLYWEHLCRGSGLAGDVVLAAAGLSRAAGRRLSRCGPRRGRIPAGEAAALFGLTLAQVLAARDRQVCADHAASHLHLARRAGWAPSPSGARPGQVDATLAKSQQRTCSQWEEWQAVALTQQLGLRCPLVGGDAVAA